MGEVFEFTVNGQVQRTEEDKPLLRYLRDDLKLYSVKDGCSEGDCGTCTIRGRWQGNKSCVLTTKRAVGRNILTVEGLSDEWKERLCMHSEQSEPFSVVSVFRAW